MKYCGGCEQQLPFDAFNRHSGKPDGYQTQCRKCIKKARQNWASNNPEKRRKRKLKANYNLTTEDYNNLLKEQNYVCAICGTKDTRNKNYTFLPVDHCHKTGKVRGILCDYCNVGLGRFEDDVERLKRAIDYLKKNSESSKKI
jgi:hypothetical protein